MLTGAIGVRLVTGLVIIVVLLSMLIQDWRSRGIYWYCFPILAAALISSRLLAAPLSLLSFAEDVVINLVFIAAQLAAIRLYTQWRFRPSPGALSQYLGAGDILYWLTTALFFPPLPYMLYFITSLITALLVFVGIRQLQPRLAQGHVPLAGLQAGFLAVLLLGIWLLPDYWRAAERSLTSYLTGQ